MSGFSAGDSSAVPFSAVFRLARGFLPDFPPSSKRSSAASTVEGSSSTPSVRPLFPGFCFLPEAGVLPLALTGDSEVDGVAGVDGGVLDN